jgi:hypothetical protein
MIIPTEYPNGAIQTTLELSLVLGKEIWVVSRKHTTNVEYYQILVTIRASNSSPVNDFFCAEDPILGVILNYSSSDMNIDGLNGYNDWFVFSNQSDARDYINGVSTASAPKTYVDEPIYF